MLNEHSNGFIGKKIHVLMLFFFFFCRRTYPITFSFLRGVYEVKGIYAKIKKIFTEL